MNQPPIPYTPEQVKALVKHYAMVNDIELLYGPRRACEAEGCQKGWPLVMEGGKWVCDSHRKFAARIW